MIFLMNQALYSKKSIVSYNNSKRKTRKIITLWMYCTPIRWKIIKKKKKFELYTYPEDKKFTLIMQMFKMISFLYSNSIEEKGS